MISEREFILRYIQAAFITMAIVGSLIGGIYLLAEKYL